MTLLTDLLHRATALVWPGEPDAQVVLAAVLLLGGILFLGVHAPVLLSLRRLGGMQDTLRAALSEPEVPRQRARIHEAFEESTLDYQWETFVRRWEGAVVESLAGAPELERAPVRLADVLAEHPVPASGRSPLAAASPWLLLGLAGLGALVTIGLLAQTPGASIDARMLPPVLPVLTVGVLLALLAATFGRALAGRHDAQCEALDRWVELAFGSISSAELSGLAASTLR